MDQVITEHSLLQFKVLSIAIAINNIRPKTRRSKMTGFFRPNIRTWFLLLGILFIVLSTPIVTPEYAQTGCPPVSNNGWPKCVIVYYTITGFDQSQKTQLLNALTSWNTANRTNNSRVKFQQ